MGHRAPSIADKARVARAKRTAADLAPAIAQLQAAGITSLNAIADTQRASPTPEGSGRWYAVQVSLLLERLAERYAVSVIVSRRRASRGS
jgi:hypothetical protein